MPDWCLTMKWPRIATALVLGAPLVLRACVRTTYHGYDAAEEPQQLVERRVQFHLSDAYFRTAPRCTAVLVARSPAPANIRRAVADAVERHLALRIARVMGAAETRRAAAQLGVDPAHPADRRVFARQTGCGSMVRVRIENLSDDYFVVWSRRAIAISLEMTRSDDGRLLWKARHRAGRDDGGVPFSVFSLPYAVVRAARLNGDREVFESIADDALRRMTATLPDLRAATRPAF